jgi:ABC transporter DrrB family efflux protein
MAATTIDRPRTFASTGDPMSVTTVTTFDSLDIRPAERTASAFATATAVGRRTVRKFVRTPQQLVLGTVTGAMFLLIFRYVFGGAIDAGPVPYVDFLVPGYIVTSVLFTGGEVSVGFAQDLEAGVTDRFRSLPVSRAALLAGRIVAESLLLVMGLAITTAIGFLVGFRIHGSVVEALAAFGLAVVFGFAFVWVFIVMGLTAGSAQAAQGMSLLVFPLTFVSSAYVPVESMPGRLQPVAEHQPITAMVNAVRSLVLGGADAAGLSSSTGYWVAVALLWSLGLVVVFGPIAVARYRRTA